MVIVQFFLVLLIEVAVVIEGVAVLVVFIVEGSSARMAVPEKEVPIDTAIIAIIDAIERDGKIVFRKSVEEFAAV